MTSTSERGAATFVMLGVLAVVISLAVAVMILGGYVVAVHRARTAADLAALSGAAEFARGGEPCPVARRAAVENQAKLVSCDQVGDQLDFVITARVRVAIGQTVPGLPRSVEAVAYAGAESE
jgi:secretion/DNA translocation related TadE-like protein